MARYWHYKAYDIHGRKCEGVIESVTHWQAILHLRQGGEQVYDIQTITYSEYRFYKRALPSKPAPPGFPWLLVSGVAAGVIVATLLLAAVYLW